ncbi:methyl jasmonate esterase 1-like [Nicotiana tomentosiformis]|uniref:methyl jasmonate esterase 1-like n=1 Tax=Nicotiana tomentosiformis TaxID=4098 RepID=UPI00051B6711|nr:probable esterase PIR7A [Nicotiana tomentosiformis]
MEKGQRRVIKSHFVFVHGLGHGAWCWYKVITTLISLGYKATALDLAASGVHYKESEEVKSLSDYVEPLMHVVELLPPDDRLILVGHGMGGLAISLATEKFPKKIAAAVFVAAYMPGPDFPFSHIIQQSNQGLDFLKDNKYKFDNGTDKPPTAVYFGSNFLSSKMYQYSRAEDMILASLLMRHTPMFHDPEVLKEAELTKEKYGSIPRVYIMCSQDLSMKADVQRWMIEKNPPQDVKVILGSDHMVMFSKTQEFCSRLMEIAEKYH